MELYIKIKNGVPVDHPITGDNMRLAFPDIDLNDLPNDYARFERVESPVAGIYEINDGSTYGLVDGIYKDVWQIRAMTDAEKTEKQDEIKAEWAANGYASWVFNEQTCSFDPPTPRPDDGNRYTWSEETTSWIEFTE